MNEFTVCKKKRVKTDFSGHKTTCFSLFSVSAAAFNGCRQQ